MLRLVAGSRLGDLTIVRPLGAGGMGAVLEARDAAGRALAVKVLHEPADGEVGRRFVREARLAARITHPNVTRVHALGEHEGVPYIVFELVRGGSLQARLREGPLPWREVARLGAQAARGLEALHAAGVIHRDVKPDNLLLDDEGNVKVADLGLAREVAPASGDLTKTGALLGTVAYMSPEQANGSRELDARTDVYALGATLFALLAGRPPFEGSTPQVMYQLFQGRAPAPSSLAPGVPDAVDDLVLACLEREPEDRPQTAGAVAATLEAIARGEPVVVARRGRRRAVFFAGVAAVGLVLALSAVLRPKTQDAVQAPLSSSTPKRSAPPTPARERAREAMGALAAGDLPRAASIAADAVAADASNADGWAVLAEVRARRHDRDRDALAAVNRALALDARSARALAARAALEAESLDWTAAARDAASALAIDSHSAHALAVRAQARLWLAPPDEAAAAARADGERASTLDPSLALAWVVQGLSYVRQDRPDDDRVPPTFREALRLDPENAWALFVEACFDERTGRFEASKNACQQALRIDPRPVEFRAELAYADLLLGDFGAALADADKVVQLDPKNEDGLHVRARANLRLGSLDLAQKDADALLAIEKKTNWAHYIRGEVLAQRHELEDAQNEFAAALRDSRSFAIAAVRLAETALARNTRSALEEARDILAFCDPRGPAEEVRAAKELREKIIAQVGTGQ